MSDDSLYKRSYRSNMSKWVPYAPEAFQAFSGFNAKAAASGALSEAFKEIMAVSLTHVTGCPYCLDIHVGKAKALNVSKEQLIEAIMVAAAVQAYAALANGVNMLNAYDGNGEDELYKRSYLNRLGEFESIREEQYTAFFQFNHQAFRPGLLTEKEKLLIALAVAHVNGSAYGIDEYTRKAKKAGASLHEVAEAMLVAATLKAGAALAHRANALNAYER